MLIDLNYLIRKHDLKINGVIHIGAHFGQEFETYEKLGIKNLMFFEPLDSNFQVLEKNVSRNKAKLFNIGLGNYTGFADLFLEAANQGMSCSILEPALHLQYYPNIIFNGSKRIEIDKLDNIEYNRNNFNMINIDIQGYELEAFKGAIDSLKHIDYIYTEVNVAELYHGCVTMGQLDEFLEDFERVETQLVPEKWGDALYIRKKKAKSKYKGKFNLDIPENFKLDINIKYPPTNEVIFEQWFDIHFRDKINTERIYLPIYWTGYHVNHNASKKHVKILQSYINTLSPKEKYFTIVQYDDGTLVDFKNLDIIVFSMGGGKSIGKKVKTIPIPLLSFDYGKERFSPKEYYCTFIGSFTTHRIRNIIRDKYAKNPRFFISSIIPNDLYCEYMKKSIFVLCPRGYGLTSFRIWEALYFNAVPVYISDEFWLPFNEPFDYGIKIDAKDIDKIENIIDKVYYNNDLFSNILTKGKEVLDEYFNYNGLAQKIINYINSLEPAKPKKEIKVKTGKRKTSISRTGAKRSVKSAAREGNIPKKDIKKAVKKVKNVQKKSNKPGRNNT